MFSHIVRSRQKCAKECKIIWYVDYYDYDDVTSVVRLTVMTARALLSEKSIPSLTLPRHTARKSAPVRAPAAAAAAPVSSTVAKQQFTQTLDNLQM